MMYRNPSSFCLNLSLWSLIVIMNVLMYNTCHNIVFLLAHDIVLLLSAGSKFELYVHFIYTYLTQYILYSNLYFRMKTLHQLVIPSDF